MSVPVGGDGLQGGRRKKSRSAQAKKGEQRQEAKWAQGAATQGGQVGRPEVN